MAVGNSLGPAGGITPAIAEDSPGEHHHMIVRHGEVRVPPVLGTQYVGKRCGELVGPLILGFEVDKAPHIGLGRRNGSGDVHPL